MNEQAVIIFTDEAKKIRSDLRVPLDITADELVIALNSAFDLGIDIQDVKSCYLKAENPIVLLKGNRTLREFGIRNGSVIRYS
ncbi:MAG: EsaB/YukD family protein [Mogibacterium sp.]|nr:EsaB/YukD family protein [Mogibacterium sp.]